MTVNGLAPCAVVLTSIDSEAAAEALASRLVELRLAACVQILPIRSVYRWRGAVERSSEWLLLVKSPVIRFEEIERVIRESHSYETPEVVMLPIERGSSDYLRWLLDESAGIAS